MKSRLVRICLYCTYLYIWLRFVTLFQSISSNQRIVFYLSLCENSLVVVVVFPVPAAAPSPDEEAPAGPDMDVEELEKEPSGWKTQNASNLFSIGLSFSPSVEQVMLKVKVPLISCRMRTPLILCWASNRVNLRFWVTYCCHSFWGLKVVLCGPIVQFKVLFGKGYLWYKKQKIIQGTLLQTIKCLYLIDPVIVTYVQRLLCVGDQPMWCVHFRLWENLPMQRALLGSTLQVTKLNEVLKLCVAAAVPSPEEGAPVGPDMTDVEELEEEPSGWRTEHASNLFSTGLVFSPSVEL